jgi:hypothetical protein
VSLGIKNEQRQGQTQIPFGDDNKRTVNNRNRNRKSTLRLEFDCGGVDGGGWEFELEALHQIDDDR